MKVEDPKTHRYVGMHVQLKGGACRRVVEVLEDEVDPLDDYRTLTVRLDDGTIGTMPAPATPFVVRVESVTPK